MKEKGTLDLIYALGKLGDVDLLKYVNIAKVDRMTAFIHHVGQWDLPPITVVQGPEGDYLSDGHHRVAAAKRLGYSFIPARILTEHDYQRNVYVSRR